MISGGWSRGVKGGWPGPLGSVYVPEGYCDRSGPAAAGHINADVEVSQDQLRLRIDFSRAERAKVGVLNMP